MKSAPFIDGYFVLQIVLIVSLVFIGKSTGQSLIQAFFDPESGQTYLTPNDLNCTEKHHKTNLIDFCRIGERVKNDRIVDRLQEVHSFHNPTNISLDVEYPRANQKGYIITYVEMKIYQSSNLIRYIIISGGIGQTHTTLRLASNLTTHLNYDVCVFGL